MSLNKTKLKKSKLSKQKSKHEEKQRDVAPLTLSKIKKILESPTYKANRNILVYKDFIKEAKNIFSNLSVEDRYNFLNNHLNETKLNKWSDQKSKFMDISKSSSQHTPLSISWYNFTYAHTPIQASKIWYNFINLMIDFKQGAAECDLKNCKQSDCKHHLTIIDELYAFVNTSDESLYAISTQEFTVRGGFKLLLKIFSACGINSPIPPLILCSDEYKQHELLAHFTELDHAFLFAISPNEVRFSWIKQMLHNAHPIMSEKKYLHQLLQTFYPKTKKIVKNDIGDENVVFDINIDDETKHTNEEINKTAVIETGRMAEMGVLSWLLVTLPTLLDVRYSQKKLLSKEFDKYAETAANSTLIDTMLDYLYWEEKYILEQISQVRKIIICNKNELILFKYISNEYCGNVALAMFIKQFIGIHMDNNNKRNSLEILFDNDSDENNAFYFKLIRHIFGSNSMVSRLDDYLPFLLSKIVWTCSDGSCLINQLLFDNLLSAILSYIERYVSDKSIMMKIVKKWTYSNAKDSNDEILSKLVNVRRDKTKQMVLKWIIKILKLLGNKKYTQQFIYQLSVLHFKTIYQNECVEEFTLKLFRELIKNGLIFDNDLMNYYIDGNTHISKELTVIKPECILWLLCRCCFDKAIDIFLFYGNNGNKMKNSNWLFINKQIEGKYNNVFLSLSQSLMSDAVTNAPQMQCARVNIFKMLCKYGKINNINIEDIKKCLLQKGELNGKNSFHYALENNYQPLYNEMKQFISY